MAKKDAPVKRESAYKGKFMKEREKNKKLRQKKTEEKQDTMGDFVTVGTGLALGAMKRKGKSLPNLGIDVESTITWGAGLMYVAPRFIRGRTGRLAQAAGRGALTVGAFNYGRHGTLAIQGAADDDMVEIDD